MLLTGTYVKFKIIRYLQSVKKSTDAILEVDDLALFEQRVNFFAAPLILMQVIRLIFPLKQILGNIWFCSFWFSFNMFVLFHRAIGGLGIAGVRQVICTVATII